MREVEQRLERLEEIYGLRQPPALPVAVWLVMEHADDESIAQACTEHPGRPVTVVVTGVPPKVFAPPPGPLLLSYEGASA